jgi:hypothetical protein
MIRVGTWNVLGMQGFREADAVVDLGPPGEEASLARWADAFGTLACDALGLQEGVPHEWIRDVARRGGWNVATVPSPQSWPGHVLSSHPIRETRVFSHAGPSTSREDPFSRCFGASLLDLPVVGATWLVVLHTFPSRPETPEPEARRRREGEADLLEAPLDALVGSGAHVVVVGDFNSDVDERLHGVLRERGFANAMATAGGGVQPTFGKHGERPDHVYALDHVYVDGSLAPALRGARVVRDEGFWYPGAEQAGRWVLSDHLPVVADLGSE